MIEVRGLTKDYAMGASVVHALRGVDARIEAGELVAIMGPSGSGKSTFMNIVGCLDRPTSGEYRLQGQAMSALRDRELAQVRNRRIGFVFQTFNLLPRKTALDNVALPLSYRSGRDDGARARLAIAEVGLEDRMKHRPVEMSGGQQQRVAIARALVNDPDLVLADEPTGNLDSRTSEEIMALFQKINRSGKTLLIVTHELDIARHCRRILSFKDGLILRDEPVANPLDAPEILASLPNVDAGD